MKPSDHQSCPIRLALVQENANGEEIFRPIDLPSVCLELL